MSCFFGLCLIWIAGWILGAWRRALDPKQKQRPILSAAAAVGGLGLKEEDKVFTKKSHARGARARRLCCVLLFSEVGKMLKS